MAAARHYKSTARNGNKGEQPEEAELVACEWRKDGRSFRQQPWQSPRSARSLEMGQGRAKAEGIHDREELGQGGRRASAAKSSAVAMAGAQPALVVAP
jgi:hypothetical protein